MRRILPIVSLLAIVSLLLSGSDAHAQKILLQSDGWGSISGTVTFDGDVINLLAKVKKDSDDLLAKMKIHPDKACCLAPAAKPIEKAESTWIVDPKTKAIANVIVWIAPPKGTYFPMHPNYLKRKDHEIGRASCRERV